MTNPTLDAALRYVKAGLRVLPCKGKRPVTQNGFHDASAVPEVLRAWFENPTEELNVAIALPEWLVCLDVDGEDGRRNLEAHGYVPPATATVKTPRGWHYYYIWKGEQAPLRKIGFLPHVDVLSNGYTLVPPSSGYAWQDGSFSEKDLEIAPEWLVTAVSEFKSERERVNVEEWFEGLPRGSHQTGLFRYASRLRSMPRMTKTEAKVLVAELAHRCKDAGKWDGGLPAYTNTMVERVWKTYDAAEEVDSDKESKVWSLADLLSNVHDKPNYLVDRLLPGVGYTILFAAQGVGKSVLADQVAIAIATGQRIFNRDVKRSGVLVLDIEQDPAAAAERWRKMMFGMGLVDPPANLFTTFSWPLLEDGGFDKLADFVVEHPHVRLIVVDTLAQATAMSGEGGSNAYFQDSRSMGRFTRFAKTYGLAFLIVTHSRKASRESPDSFADMASGTRGITGPAKARWGLVREEGGAVGRMMVGGKIPETTLNLTFDSEYLMWR